MVIIILISSFTLDPGIAMGVGQKTWVVLHYYKNIWQMNWVVKEGCSRFASKGLHVYGHAINALIPKVGFMSNSDRIKELKELLGK